MAQLFAVPTSRLVPDAIVQRHEELVKLLRTRLQETIESIGSDVVPLALELHRSLDVISKDAAVLSSPAIIKDIENIAELFSKIQTLVDCYQTILADGQD
jgi:hypothetical protein